jgi:hypothetical protein
LEEAQYFVIKTLTGTKGNFDSIVHVHRGGMNRSGGQQQTNSEKNETFHKRHHRQYFPEKVTGVQISRG